MRRVFASSLLVVALAACGRSGDTTVTAGGTSAGAGGAAASSSSSSPTSAASDQAVAQRVLVRVTDLPGYDAVPALSPQPQAVKGASTFESCAGATITLGDPERTALSPAF